MAQTWKRELRWSTRVHLMLLTLKDVAVPGLDQAPLPGATRDHWLVWQSLTRTGHPTLLPTDPGRLVDALGVRKEKGGDLVAAAIGQLMANLYESRSV
jgi:hypothetical protein